ncbi:huntingtin-interacting protein K isoform X2 [Hermetia illucens]|uniref:huntingtin-interacting protein K isoform X2 n=1 Tax=Hermetia illucens TaxID=343691 RepID=UPI0018CC2FA4|nr:huntingtin-interacting protein K isoform X2 [Hermetia illucens]
MSGSGDTNGSEEIQDKKQKKVTKHDGGAADLERVTDYAEEKEISSADMSSAVNMFGDKRSRENEERLAKELELQKIHIKKEDVSEMLISKPQAEKILREHSGDVVAALQELTN